MKILYPGSNSRSWRLRRDLLGPAQMSNKLNNLIIIMNNNLFNLNNKININYNINHDIIKYFSINNSTHLSNETCIV
jgi:hypothetical protein